MAGRQPHLLQSKLSLNRLNQLPWKRRTFRRHLDNVEENLLLSILRFSSASSKITAHSAGVKLGFLEGVNGVNRLATNGKKHYRLPKKNVKKITDYRHGPTLSIFFSERRVYCIFSTFLGSNQRYHVTSLFKPQNEDIEIEKAERMPKISTTRLVLHIKCEKWLDKSSKKILSSSVESSTYKPTVPRWAQRQQFPLPTFSCHILKHKV